MSILDFKSEDEILFDPGYSGSVARVSGNIDYLYSAFSAIPSLKQKKFQFSILYPKFLKSIELNSAFYLGCMLWGVYLKSLKNRKIVNNPCFGTEFDDECFFEVDFLINFITGGLNRDAKYYLNKTYTPNPLYIKILENYKEFLSLNKGFIEVEKTDDILLPVALKNPNDADIKEIYNAILFTVADKILP